ncbi:MAG: GNAT family N-acetyltransferase [Pseudomonadota bacterium]
MDVISENGHLFLGSRLKRLSDRFLTDATKITHSIGFADLYPSQTVLIAALEKSPPVSVSNLAKELGLSQPAVTRNLSILGKQSYVKYVSDPSDQRQKLISLSVKGQKLAGQLRARLWGKIEKTVAQICQESSPDFVEHLEHIEKALGKKSFEERFMEEMQCKKNSDVEIVEFSDDLAQDFYDINAAWIAEKFVLEDVDKQVLSNPKTQIIDGGGAILFAKHKDFGIVGTCALMNCGTAFELTKMGVRAEARGLKIGETLLVAALEKAKLMGIKRLFLLTNAQQEAAIHLYEKLGFVHSREIMEEFGHEYERCNVAMDYPLI